MIYLVKVGTTQYKHFPRDWGGASVARLQLYSTINHKYYVDAEVVDLTPLSMCCKLAVTLPEDAPSGEYKYFLRGNEGEILSCGLVIVEGSDAPRAVGYEQEYKQFEI